MKAATLNRTRKMVRCRTLSLRPYPGTIKLFDDLSELRRYYEASTGDKYPYHDEVGGGRYVRLEGKGGNEKDVRWLVYGRKPHTLAHEFTHILLRVWHRIGSDPHEGGGEPFCYMLSQLMIDAR